MLLSPSDSHTIEGNLLRGLSHCHGNDVMGALDKIPLNSKLLYLHAYQALVWNKVVSKRFAEFGHSVLIGDLVMLPKGEKGNAVPSVADNENGGDKKNEDTDKWVAKRQQKFARLHYVETESEVAKFTIFNVVMPVPGHDVPMPKHPSLVEAYQSVLTVDGISSFEDFKSKHESYSLAGDVRKVAARPLDLTWRLIQYDDPDKDLQISDADVLDGKEEIKSDSQPKEENGHLHHGLILSMSLKSSMYATMALREITRTDTGKASQTSLSQKHQYKKEVETENGVASKRNAGNDVDEEKVPEKKSKGEGELEKVKKDDPSEKQGLDSDMS